MKKISFSKIMFSLLILFVFSLGACKKDKDKPSSSGYYVKFKLDGSDKEYSKTTVALFSTSLPVYSLAMVGEQQNGTVDEGMAINIFDSKPIAVNVTYTDQTVAGSGAVQATLLYTDANGVQETSAFGTDPNVKVVITNLDDKTVTGTFSGKITNTTDLTSSQTVTEGQFYLPRQ